MILLYIQVAKIQASDAEEGDYFGYAVAMEGDYLVIGAYKEDTNGSNAGSAYVFKKDSNDIITQIEKIQASDVQDGDYFAYSLDIDGDYIVLSSHKEDTTENNAGSVYVFKKGSDDTISQIAKIQSDTPEDGAFFGKSVSMQGDYIAIGAYR